MAAIPGIKLLGMAVRLIAKPMAKELGERASHSAFFRSTCVSLGQTANRVTFRMRMLQFKNQGMVSGSAGFKVTPLDEEKAVANGAALLAELTIYGVASAVVIFEYGRSKRKEYVKDDFNEARDQRQTRNIGKLQEEVAGLRLLAERQQETLDRLSQGYGKWLFGADKHKAMKKQEAEVVEQAESGIIGTLKKKRAVKLITKAHNPAAGLEAHAGRSRANAGVGAGVGRALTGSDRIG